MVSAGGSFLGKIANFTGGLMQTLNIFRSGDPDTEEWGDRAIQAEDQHIFPDQFNDFNDYLDKLRNFELDPEKTVASTPEQKTIKGLEVAGRALEDRFHAPEGSMAKVFVLAGANPEYFTSTRFKSLLEGGIHINDIADYFEGRLGVADAIDVENALVQQERENFPERDEQTVREELYQAVDATQEHLRTISR
jgi:hypothetical protein